MSTLKEDFLNFQAQTSPYPMGLEVSRAEGSYIYDMKGNAYLDFVAGVSACTLGHCHPKVVKAICQQSKSYMHTMVYGEFITKSAVALCRKLSEILPYPLRVTYLVNSGTEATEGAIKLAKASTKRSEIIAAQKSYHGNTQGSMSVMGHEPRKSPFRPLIPDVKFIRFNEEDDISQISDNTAAVILETIQGSAGFITPENDYLKKIKKHCEKMGTLLILDEVQTGFGRTGSFFAFQQYGVIPDILVMGKGMASGMPIGAFTTSRELMSLLSEKYRLGHITTFGGNPVVASSALVTLGELQRSNLINEISEKEWFIKTELKHPKIKNIRGKGLMLALEMEDKEIANQVIKECLKERLILFWLLFDPKAIRITPPLNISLEEIKKGIDIIKFVLG
ncbi:acetylornithine aminotransferase [Elysia marginata]|uniref:Acetylornithine aminotransferase n=1 Tax=Elysia marginata TaxID=1093978 RepID=A0AAV4FMN7_9GAST|nr:acetylornithine aminotransferase [Elysia marginata]